MSNEKTGKHLTCSIISDSNIHSFLSIDQAAFIALNVSYHFSSKSSGGSSSSEFQCILVGLDKIKAKINGTDYPVKVQTQYSTFLGKKYSRVNSSVYNLLEYKNYTYSYQSDKYNKSELNKFRGIDATLDKYIDYYQNPDKDINLRTYQVRMINIEEFIFQNSSNVAFNYAYINRDTLFLQY